MPVLIVDPLEVIDIQHDDRQCPRRAVKPHHLRLEAILEIATVVDAGQGVGNRQRTQLFFHPLEIGNIRHLAMP